MKDYYKILGLTNKATQQEIKQSYYALAKVHHPDKGGDVNKMADISEAYAELYDPEKRALYDKAWENSPEGLDENADLFDLDEEDKPDPIPFSLQFKKQYVEFISQFRRVPAEKKSPSHLFTRPTQGIYSHQFQNGHVDPCNDIFSYIARKNALNQQEDSIAYLLNTPLTPEIAVGVLIDFLEGDFVGLTLSKLRRFVTVALNHAKTKGAMESLLYEAMITLFSYAEGSPKPGETLFQVINKITDYVKQTAHYSMPCTAILLQNKYYRHFYQQVITDYWRATHKQDLAELIMRFNGYEEARELLTQMAGRLARETEDPLVRESLERSIKLIKVLYRFEKELHANTVTPLSANAYRDLGNRILDWIPSFNEKVPTDILVNILIQSALQFQIASMYTFDSVQKMADERMAFTIYMNVLTIAHRSSLDTELYAYMHCLKYISAFEYTWSDLKELIPHFQERCFQMASVFPLYEPEQSNVHLLTDRLGLLPAMRGFLHTLINIIEKNKSADLLDKVDLDHSHVTILYQAYEACLRNWYEETYNTETEQKIRITLMKALLKEKKWHFDHLDKNIQMPWIMIDRAQDGWMRGMPQLPIPNRQHVDVFTEMTGVELDHVSGEVVFILKPWDSTYPNSNRVVTLHDVREMLQKNITHGVLSLDPVDRLMDFHPFNQIRIIPSTLHDSHFLQTMLLTDYILKFLTVGHEVNGQYPYLMRPVDKFLEKVPMYLRKIIDDFHKTQKAGSIHRFWVEAMRVDAYLSADNKDDSSNTKIAIPRIKMVVRKQLMVREADGTLIDKDEQDEGWQVHVHQSQNQILCISPKQKTMAFHEGTRNLYLLDEDKIFLYTLPKEYDDILTRLCKQPRNLNGLVPKTEESAGFLYHFVKTMCIHLKRPHYYTPEYVFAQEFTAHYDEFSLYIPEFGRLKELSRISAFINLVNGLHNSNNENIKRLEELMSDKIHWKGREDLINNAIDEVTRVYKLNLKNVFDQTLKQYQENANRWRTHYRKATLLKNQRSRLASVREDVGALDFDRYSDEVIEICEKMYEDNKNRIIREYGWPSWNASQSKIRSLCNEEKDAIAEKLSQHKRTAITEQLLDTLSSAVDSSIGVSGRTRAIERFLDGDDESLVQMIVDHEFERIVNDIANVVKSLTRYQIIKTIDGDDSYIESLSAKETIEFMRPHTEEYEAEKKKLKQIIPEEKAKIQAKLNGFIRLRTTLSGLGIGQTTSEPSLEGTCLWVPASIDHHRENGYSRLVYGGVNISPDIKIDNTDNEMSRAAIRTSFAYPREGYPSDILIARTQPDPEPDGSTPNGLFQMRLYDAFNKKTAELAAKGISVEEALNPEAARNRGNGSSSSSSSSRGRSTATASAGATGGKGGGRSPSPPDRSEVEEREDKYHQYRQAPDLPDGFPGVKKATAMTPDGNGKLRRRWRLPDGRILEWDRQHGEVEMYTKNGKRHLGSYDPKDGKQLKPPKPGRNIAKFVN